MTVTLLEPSAATASVPGAMPPPDAGLVARLANEFFSALPGQPVPALGAAQPSVPALEGTPTLVSAPRPPAPLPTLPPSGPTAGLSAGPAGWAPAAPPQAPDLAAIVHSLGGALSLVPPVPGAVPAVHPLAPPALPSGPVPGGLPLSLDSRPVASGEGFYFVDEALARSAWGGIQAPPAAPIPAAPKAGGPAYRPESLELRTDQVPSAISGVRPFDAASIRRDFPLLEERVHGKPLIWLDNAATTQKPRAVIDRLKSFYEHENSNIHRGAHALAARATDAYEAAREKTRRFLNAGSVAEIVFVRGATEGINLIAQAWGRRNVGEGDEIVVTWLEHHANIVPWQQLAAEKGARLRVAPVDDSGQVILDEYEKLLNPRTRIVSFTQVSNALGTVTPAREMVEIAHRHGAVVLVDGAQAVSHMPVDVQALDADFYVFSGHKVFAPTGIGVVYGKEDILNAMPPWQGGGNMIQDVTFEKTVYQPAPFRFEAGTGNIADAVGLGAAIDYLDTVGMDNVARWEHELLAHATQGLLTVPGLTLIGTAKEKAGVLSFVLDGCRTEDVGAALDREGIAVRSGHHCAQPILRRFGLESTVRPSLALYNTLDDIDALVAALLRIQSGRGFR